MSVTVYLGIVLSAVLLLRMLYMLLSSFKQIPKWIVNQHSRCFLPNLGGLLFVLRALPRQFTLMRSHYIVIPVTI